MPPPTVAGTRGESSCDTPDVNEMRARETMLHIDKAALAACLDRKALIDALDDAFRKPYSVPLRQQYQLPPAAEGQNGGTLLLMPAWNAGGGLGIKIVTVFADNALRSLPAVCANYLLL